MFEPAQSSNSEPFADFLQQLLDKHQGEKCGNPFALCGIDLQTLWFVVAFFYPTSALANYLTRNKRTS